MAIVHLMTEMAGRRSLACISFVFCAQRWQPIRELAPARPLCKSHGRSCHCLKPSSLFPSTSHQKWRLL